MMRSGSFGPDVWEALKMAFFMMWETLWALILGFGLSGVVQAFVPREAMERRFGRHTPKAIAQATGLGMVSSSCSYAAAAMSKSLFQKGADFITSMVFMFASTNLVLELGIILAVLMGWQFAAAEFIGGPIMIVLLVLVGSVVFTRHLTTQARENLGAGARASTRLGPRVEGGLGRRRPLHARRSQDAAEGAGDRLPGRWRSSPCSSPTRSGSVCSSPATVGGRRCRTYSSGRSSRS